MRCRICDNELPVDALFCDQCGTRIRGWHAVVTPPPASTHNADLAESPDNTDTTKAPDDVDTTEVLAKEDGQGEQDQRNDSKGQDDSVQRNDDDRFEKTPREADADPSPDNGKPEASEPIGAIIEPDSPDEEYAEQEELGSGDAGEDEPDSESAWTSKLDSELSPDADADVDANADKDSQSSTLEADDPFEPESPESATVPSFRIPSCASVVVPPSPPEEPKLGRSIVISIGAIALAVAILILIGTWITIRAMFV